MHFIVCAISHNSYVNQYGKKEKNYYENKTRNNPRNTYGRGKI